MNHFVDLNSIIHPDKNEADIYYDKIDAVFSMLSEFNRRNFRSLNSVLSN